MNSIAFGISCATLLLLICVCVGSVVLKYANPAASRIPLPDAGGSQAGFDILPCVTGSLALASPLAGLTPPSGHSSPDVVWAMGRGMNDYHCANDVTVTIEDSEIWIDIEGRNVWRAKRIKGLQVDDRRSQARV